MVWFVFWVGKLNYANEIWLRQTTVTMITKILELYQKICRNSACIEDTSSILDQTGGFRDGRINCANEICLTPTTVTKIWKFKYKITISRLAYDHPLPYPRP